MDFHQQNILALDFHQYNTKIFIAIEQLKRKKEVREIPFRLGYKESNSFTRFFIQHTNVNPYMYAKLSEDEKQSLVKECM